MKVLLLTQVLPYPPDSGPKGSGSVDLPITPVAPSGVTVAA